MPITAQSADGVTHEFPDGTKPDIIDKAMKTYATTPQERVQQGFQGLTSSPAAAPPAPPAERQLVPQPNPETAGQPGNPVLIQRQRATTPLGKAVEPITSLPSEYLRIVGEAKDTMAKGVQDIQTPGSRIKGAFEIGVGALDYVTSPLSAPVHTIIGRPIEETTGIPHEWTEFATMLGLPGANLSKTAKGKELLAPLEKILSPSTVSPQAESAAASIRAAGGQAARDTATTAAEMEPFHRAVNALPDADRLNFINHVEGGAAPVPPQLAPLATKLKDAFDLRMQKLMALPSKAQAEFIEDYYPHFWKDPTGAQQFVKNWGGQGKQGSGASLRKRTVPTIADGIAAGLQPLTTDPIEATMRYVTSMDRFIASTSVLDAAKANGTVRYIRPKVMGASGHPESLVKNVPKKEVAVETATSPNTGDKIADSIYRDIENGNLEMPDAGTLEYEDAFHEIYEARKEGVADAGDMPARRPLGSKSGAELGAMFKYATGQVPRAANVNVKIVGRESKTVIPDGWIPLKGRGSVNSIGEQAYAPADWAEVYNNFISRGFHANENAGRIYDALQSTSNAITSLELGLSGYHAFTMANEAIISEVARGISNIVGGKPIRAIGNIVAAPLAPVMTALRGHKAEQVYLGRSPGSPDMRKIVDLQTAAGGRAVGKGHAPDYRFSAMGSYWTAFKRGALKQQMRESMANVKASPLIGGAKEAGRVIGRSMETIAAPIFEKYIPKIKNGAFYDTMHDWLQANPMAPYDEQVKAARQIWDSIDNRFGEMVQDNIFWNKTLKQVAQLGMRSYSWNLGTVREIGGGARDLLRGEWTPKASYVVALPIVVGSINAAYQYLKSGKTPESLDDLAAGRTGGTAPGFGGKGTVDERAMMPGYQKDVLGWYHDWKQEAINKIASGPRLLEEAIAGTDWMGKPIARPDADVPQWLTDYFNWVTQSMGPISLRTLGKGEKTGSNISMPEQAMGVRPAPSYLQDPEGYQRGMRQIKQRAWKGKERYDRKQDSQYQGPQE